jgi:hypothetical protein
MAAWVQLIAVAGKSAYSLAALALLLVFSIASLFFKKERAAIKLFAFICLVALIGFPLAGHFIKAISRASISYNSGNTTVTGNGSGAATGQNNSVEVGK